MCKLHKKDIFFKACEYKEVYSTLQYTKNAAHDSYTET